MFTDTVVIGAGQAGLAVSAELTRHRRDHVVLERGRLAERWRTERWDSLRLLTPNWMTRLPGFRTPGTDPDGFLSAPELVDHLGGFARSFDAPVVEETAVLRVEATTSGFAVTTTHETWRSSNVVVATGWCDQPAVPMIGSAFAPDIAQLSPSDYRNPSSISPGGVLVVGASASGAQIADELARAGRHVVLCVGRHMPVPRRYRGHDIMCWFERLGTLDRRARDVGDLDRLRSEPSLQLIGGEPDARVDLATLQRHGVQLAGRLHGITGARVTFGADLPATVARAGHDQRRLLARIDAFDQTPAADDESVAARDRADRGVDLVHVAGPELDLRRAGVHTVIWATGYRRTYPWLRLPVFDETGEIRQVQGVTPIPGLYTAGMRFQTSRRSTFIDGARLDARIVVDHLVGRGTTTTARSAA